MTATVVAIDGPSASGKSSTAGAVATALGYRHLDSGALYRGVTWAAIRSGLRTPLVEGDVLDAAQRDRIALMPEGGAFDVTSGGAPVGEALRGATVTAHVSEVAAMPAVRGWITDQLRAAAARGGAVVVDGRDIGSVVFPEAELKIFLTATPEARARRRLLQRGDPVADERLQREAGLLAARDDADSQRAVAPLRQADDAVLLDTSELSFEAQVEAIVRLAAERGLKPAP